MLEVKWKCACLAAAPGAAVSPENMIGTVHHAKEIDALPVPSPEGPVGPCPCGLFRHSRNHECGRVHTTIIEFHSAAQDQYFITASPAEAAALEAGLANPGWLRTGVEWKAWGTAAEMQGAVPVCRFAVAAGAGPGSHYYTARADKCRTLKQNRGWKFEGNAFWIELPDGTSASPSCRAGTTPVYRSYRAGNTPTEGNYS